MLTMNLFETARELSRHRSTVEKHLRALLKAKIVEKIPSLSRADTWQSDTGQKTTQKCCCKQQANRARASKELERLKP